MDEGILTRSSPHPFAETLDHVERAIEGRGLTVFARIDHRAGAQRAGLDMPPATVLVFGDPKIGTPAMLAAPLLALDLPSRILVWERDGVAQVSCQRPDFVADRFGIPPDVPAHAAALVEDALG